MHELELKLAAGEEKSGLQGVFGNEDIISVSCPPKHCLQIDFFALLDTPLGPWVALQTKVLRCDPARNSSKHSLHYIQTSCQGKLQNT